MKMCVQQWPLPVKSAAAIRRQVECIDFSSGVSRASVSARTGAFTDTRECSVDLETRESCLRRPDLHDAGADGERVSRSAAPSRGFSVRNYRSTTRSSACDGMIRQLLS